jgi:hypothetical protein
MILFGFILFSLLFFVGVAMASILLIEGYKEKDGWKIIIGILVFLCITMPCIKMMYIFIEHI